MNKSPHESYIYPHPPCCGYEFFSEVENSVYKTYGRAECFDARRTKGKS